MAESYDPEYAAKIFAKMQKLGGPRIFFKDLQVLGKENLQSDGSNRRIYISNHVSHADYMTLWYQFYKQGSKMPRIAAGKNLDLPWLKKFADIGKLGAFWVDRERIKASDKEAVSGLNGSMTEILKDREDILIFPEGGRSYNNHIFDRYKTGILKRSLRLGDDPEIVSIAVDYTKRIEEDYFKALAWSKRQGKWGRRLYVGIDTFAFAKAYLLREDRTAFINAGQPKKLSEIVSDPQDIKSALIGIEEFTKTEIRRLHGEIQERK